VREEVIERYLPLLRRWLPLLQFLSKKQYGMVIVQLHGGKAVKVGYVPEMEAVEEANAREE